MAGTNGDHHHVVSRNTRALVYGLCVFATGSTAAWANPRGGTVAAGSATIGIAGKTLTINQSTSRAVINWQSFSVGAGETTRINLPSSLSAVLNRVTGADPSLIAGQISSNGQVYLINPNGIVVGPNGRINTGAFVASTLNVPNGAFMQGGGMTFMGDSGAGIRVLGTIKATNGDVVLVAAVVDNQGRITAPNGQAILGAGGQFYYVPDGQGDIVIAAPPAKGGASVNNSGAIAAANVQLRAAGSAYALAVNNNGLVSATAVNRVGGRVVLDGGTGDTVVSGTIAARTGTKGGSVVVAGQRITLTDGATIDASGSTGGGNVKVGGTNNTTTVAAGARIAVNATGSGNGGSIEISGQTLAFQGTVDLSAPLGRPGSLLLDPAVVDICTSCGTTPAAILAALVSGNTTVQATSRLTVSSPIVGTQVNRLVLDAPTIAINANISLVNGLLTLTSTLQPVGGILSSLPSASITASQIDIDGGYTGISFGGPIVTPVLNINQQAVIATSLSMANPANNIALITFSLQGDSFSGDVAIANGGAMGFVGAVTARGQISIVASGELTIQSGSVLAASGTTTLASTGGTFINSAGATLVAGTGRTLIYAATDVGFSDGGLGYTQFNPVTYGLDPMPGLTGVSYIAHASLLPAMTVKAANVGGFVGAASPIFTDILTGGTAADLALPVSHTISNGPVNAAGAYTIVPNGAISSTRALSFANGTLTVAPAPTPVVTTIVPTPTPTATPAGAIGPTTVNTATGSATFAMPANFTLTPSAATPPAATPLVVCGTGCTSFGSGPQQAEFDSIVKKFVAGLAGSTNPPLTADAVYKALSDPTQSAQMMGTLMPFVFDDLSAILAAPLSSWTPQQAAFVQAVQTYIQVQREAAAKQAMADYQAWALQQQADIAAKLKYLTGPEATTMLAVMSVNPPIPPQSIIQEAQLGMSLSTSQLAAYAHVGGQAGIVISAAAGLSTTTPGTGVGALGNLIPGTITELGSTGGTLATIFSTGGTTVSRAMMYKLAPQLVDKLAPSLGRGLTAAAKGLDTASEGLSAASKILKGVDVIELVTAPIPAVGEIAAIVGDVVQTALAVTSYARRAVFDQNLTNAVLAAQQPVSIADLQQMSTNPSGSQQLFNYLIAMAATKGDAPPVTQPTMTLQQIIKEANTL